MSELGLALRRYREAAGLSQEELAERAGLSARGVSDLERGLRRSPYPATLRRLADALGVPPVDRAALLAATRGRVTNRVPNEARASHAAIAPGAFLGARPAFQLSGRDRELADLIGANERALAGDGRLLLVSGEPGIGKTRLVQELTVHAGNRGCVIVTGRCYESQQRAAFYPILEVLASLHRQAPMMLRDSIPRRWPYLERLLPDIFAVSGPVASGVPSDEHQRMLRTVAAFVRACAAASPLVLVIDDVQWADRASLELLEHLVRYTHGEPVLLGATCRDLDGQPGHPVRRMVHDLHREGLVQQIHLQRLEPSATAALLSERLGAECLDTELAALIYGVAQGNPFFAIEVLQTLRDRGDVIRDGQRWVSRLAEPTAMPVPESVRESILERYARLDANTADVIDAASVLGPTFAIEDVAEVSGSDENLVEASLAESAKVGFVHLQSGPATPHEPGDNYAFVHPITHQVLLARIPRYRRRRLHLAAANALQQAPSTSRARVTDQIARHLLAADALVQALPYVVLAGEDAEAIFAHHEAAGHFRTAYRLAADLGDQRAQAVALFRLGCSLLTVGESEAALEHLEVAVRLHHTLEDVEGEGMALARIAQVYFARGEWDAGIERVPLLIQRLEERGPSRALALLYACLALVMVATPDERLAAAARASELGRRLGDEDILLQAEARRGFLLMSQGRLREARLVLEPILPRAEARRAYDALAMVCGVLSEVLKLTGDFAGYLELSNREGVWAEATGDTASLVGALAGVGEAQFLRGDWAAARATYQRAANQSRSLDAAWYRGFVQLGLGAIELAEGNWAAVDQQLAACLVENPRFGHHNRREHAQRLLAQRDVLASQPAAALARLEEVVAVEGDLHAGTLALKAWAWLEMGKLVPAAQAAAKAVELASERGNRLDLVEALLVHGRIAGAAGDPTTASRRLDEGLSLAQAMGFPYAEGRVRLARAEYEVRMRQTQTGYADLEAAMTIFRRLGAQPYLQQAVNLAAAVGAGV
jgi:transcriptional regulator with XRE-family HTH domain/tetratricopeptide (TPR) repeat protein